MEAPQVLQPGDRVAERYVVERLLASGGMGSVFVATHADLGTEVAIKVLNAGNGDPMLGTRFLREARAAARLKSEHIARVFDFGVLPSGHAFMALELLAGVDVDGVLELGPIPTQLAVDHILQACEGLAVAHAAGIVHRDIKPSNLFLTARADGSPLVKILDFGIAKDASDSKKTTGGMGSPYYMSPEQVRAAATVDVRTDVWALGVTLYEMLSCQRPFEGTIASQVCIAIVNDPPTRLETVVSGLPPELVAIIHRCLEKDQNQRPANVGELATLLAPFGSHDGAIHAERAARMCGGGGRASMTSISDGDRISQPRHTPSRAIGRATPQGIETLPAISSKAPPPMPSRRGRWIGVAAATAVVGLAIAGFVVLHHSADAVGGSTSASPSVAVPAPSQAALALPAVSALPSPSVAPSATPSSTGAATTAAFVKPLTRGTAAPKPSASVAHPPPGFDGTEDRN